jgi:hypothetical protein
MTTFRARTAIVFWLFVACAISLAYRAVELTIGGENKVLTNLALISRKNMSMERLNSQITELDRLTNNIDRSSIGDLKSALVQTAALLKETEIEVGAQYKAWDVIKSEMNKDDVTYQSVAVRLAEVRAQQDDQILRLQGLLDTARQPRFLATVSQYVLSFALGVLSSILASSLYSWWTGLRKGGGVDPPWGT